MFHYKLALKIIYIKDSIRANFKFIVENDKYYKSLKLDLLPITFW